MIDWKISIGAILVALLGVWLGHRLTASRQVRESYANKTKEFKKVLVPFLKALESDHAHPATLVSQHFPEQDEAARKLVIHMPNRKRHKFLQRWKRYADLYRAKQSQGVLGLFATEVDDLEKASPGAPGAEQYIYQQTARRRNEVRLLIQEALDVL